MSSIQNHFNKTDFNPFYQKYFDKHIDTIVFWSQQLTERVVWDNPEFTSLPTLTQDMVLWIGILDILPELLSQ